MTTYSRDYDDDRRGSVWGYVFLGFCLCIALRLLLVSVGDIAREECLKDTDACKHRVEQARAR